MSESNEGARRRAEAIAAIREAMPHIERAREAIGEWITAWALGDRSASEGRDHGMGIDSDLFRAQLRFQKLAPTPTKDIPGTPGMEE